MTGLWVIAGITCREAARKKLVWTAAGVALGFLALFAAALHFQTLDFDRRATSPLIRYEILSAMTLIGLYVVDLLAVLMTILTSVETVSGEIATGTIHAIAVKPVPRWQIFTGKWIGLAVMSLGFVGLAFGGTIAVSGALAGVIPDHAMDGAALVALECLIALSLTMLCGTFLSTLTSGVVVIGLQGLALMGGWLEQMSGFTETTRLVTIGILTSLVMPGEALWRRAAFEMQTPLAGALPFSAFASVSIPSEAMVAYAGLYLAAALIVGIAHFNRRDL